MVGNLRNLTKYTSITLLVGSSFALADCGSNTAGNLFGYERCANKDSKLFTFTGNVGTFTKAGFNGGKVDIARGFYPTESFTSVFGEVNGIFNINAVYENDYFSKFEIGVGAAAAGLAWDTTKYDGVNTGGGLDNGSGLNNQYIGSWSGYFGNDGIRYNNNHQIFVHNAYIDLQTRDFNLKLGRYESSMDYFSGYTQGLNFDWHFGYGDTESKPANEVKLWWFSSFGRAFAYSQWFYDYYAVKTTDTDGDGKRDASYGIHSFGVDVKHGGISDTDNGFAYGDTLLVRPFFYFYAGLYEAPGLKAVYERQFGNGFGFRVIAQGYALHVHKAFTGAKKRYDETVDEWSGNFNLIAQGMIHNYNVRIGYYQNIGSANSHFGTYGNPMGFDFWTAGVYDIGASISDVISRNAQTGYLSGGGHYNLKYGTLSWDLLGRITRSPRSDEESIALSVNHAFRNGLAVGIKLEWFRDTTKAGYNPGIQLGDLSGGALLATRTDDRSHAFFTLDYRF
ncbi:outer membrane family protein [Helicobacter trogontum]|uniref:Outer membrane family protein n=1 Tax=Helicobacter trogontum TaxID=50960 RepID=A0A4V6I283_9HELI|nr:outer membrane family protein [Helicobacter trogontum]MDY5184802.1 outer membrane family protein [Helicobacter trogontum]TLD95172.1 hypothetical protein LS80_009445 [Helicobacter trogontum]SFZ72773.1 OMP161 [Helicobacter trogontum]